MRTVTINRKKWSRGGINKPTTLCNTHSCMCCLGFAINQVSRIPKKQLKNRKNPYEVYSGKSFLTSLEDFSDPTSHNKAPGPFNNRFASEAIGINDNPIITEEDRESMLKELFKKNGIKLVFKD